MPPRIRRRTPVRLRSAKPAGSPAKGSLPSVGVKKRDPASLGGATGAPGGPARASGTSPSIRRGVERGALIAGTGLGVGAAFAIPNLFGGGDGGFFDFATDDPKDDPGGGDGGGGGGDSVFGALGEALGVNPGLLVIVVAAGGLIWLARRRS